MNVVLDMAYLSLLVR